MKTLRLAIGLGLAVLGTLGLGAANLPAAPDFFLLPVADSARGGAPVLAMVALRGNLVEWMDPYMVRRETGAERPAGEQRRSTLRSWALCIAERNMTTRVDKQGDT